MKIVKGSYGAYCLVSASGRNILPRTIVHEIKNVISKDKHLKKMWVRYGDLQTDDEIFFWLYYRLLQDEEKAKVIAAGMLNRKIMRDFLMMELTL